LAITARLLGAPRGEIDRVLDIVDLAGAAQRKVGGFSLGMRQRLGVARALIGRPRLLILDEPTNGLDPEGIRDMRTLISALPEREGVTVFVSSHLLSEVEQTATHIAMMDAGRIIAQGEVKTLKARQGRSVAITCRQPDRLVRLLGDIRIAGARREGDTVTVSGPCAEQAARDIASINSLMVERGIEVTGIQVSEPSLEDYFLRAIAPARQASACPDQLSLAA
jgi:ABC-2 type transport system ATP-binding protein